MDEKGLIKGVGVGQSIDSVVTKNILYPSAKPNIFISLKIP
jgi:hypothetical protein